MKTKIVNYLGVAVLLVTLLLNVNVISGTNAKNHLKLSSIKETWAQVSGTSSGSGSGSGSGKCWTSAEVQCSPTQVTVNSSGSSTTGGGFTYSGTVSGTHSGSGNTGTVGVTVGYSGPRNSTSSSTSTTTTTRYRTDCTSGGSSSCQAKDCDRAAIGPAQVCGA